MRQDQLFMMNVQNQCCEHFYFLIKKELMFFTNGCPCPSLATRVGWYQNKRIEKESYVQLKK